MKFILILANLIVLTQVFAQNDVLIKPHEIASKLKNSNLEIYAGATQVYNSKQRIKFARNSLLPKLNIWRLSSVLIDWKSAGEVLSQDLVPFLVPSNWQRVKEMKLFSEATNEGFHGLQKNTIFQSKLMYYQLQQEYYQFELQKEYLATLQKTINIIQGQIHFNSQINQWYRDLSYKKTLIEADLLEVERLIWEERQLLSLALGLNTNEILRPEILENEEIESNQDNLADDYSAKSPLDHSCELKEYNFLILAAPKVKNEIQWNVLGISDASRGTEGGIFDEIPIQDGLGFGMGSSLRIHKKQVEFLKKQREGISQILLRQVQSINRNLKLLSQEKLIAQEKTSILEKEKQQLQLQFSVGTRFEPLHLMEVEQKMVLAKISYANLFLRIKSENEKLKRLYEEDEYQVDLN